MRAGLWALALLACSAPPGAPADPPGQPARERWMLHGGGVEDDAIFARFVTAAGHGPVVTLGAAEGLDDADLRWWDGYFLGLGASEARTVNTLDAADAALPASLDAVRRAAAIFVRGGDQSRYVDLWFDGPMGDALVDAWHAGAVLGGSSAGCAMLGARVYDAREGTLDPWEALADAHHPQLTFTDGLPVGVPGVLTDTHFTERGRLARLALMIGHAPELTGVGVDPETALFVREDATAEVMGPGTVTLLRTGEGAGRLDPGVPPTLTGLRLWQLAAGTTVDLSAADPVQVRPDASVPVAAHSPGLPGGPLTLDGSRASTRLLGDHWLDDGGAPWAFRDRRLRLVAGEGQVPGAILLPRVNADPEWAENEQGGLLWGLARRGGLGVSLDVDAAAVLSDGAITSTGAAAVLLIDASTATHAGDTPTGWQTASLEGATLHLLGPGATWRP